MAMLIPVSGWLADRFGTRRVFIIAVSLFTLGSLACALSSSLTELVIFRVDVYKRQHVNRVLLV
uniref:Permeases of the major facilitator superfamily n=1 Tax=Klebsiella pneumoniae TaxID=573 RepID=A0A2U8T248_KLEPN|nr:Permeases of the major facilitator superfamily [Klebsiella pneumoniae]